jgi:uncharacterized damage-inducible protein DinB
LQAIAPDISQDMKKVARNESDDKELSLRALNGSAEAVTIVLQRSLDTGGKVKGFWDHAAKFLGYLIAHEAYHHGEIGIMITQAGFQLPQDIAYGIWDWKKK